MDLDEELLAVAGRKTMEGGTGTTVPFKKRKGNHPQERRTHANSTSTEEEEQEDDVDADQEEQERFERSRVQPTHDPNPGRTETRTDVKPTNERRKHARKKQERKEEEGESSAYEDGYDQDLYGDEEDRKRLEALPELEREMILYERGEEREKKWEAWKAAHEAKRTSKDKNQTIQPRGGRSGRNRKERTALDELVQEKKRRNLKANRQEKKRTQTVPAKKRIHHDEFATSEDEESQRSDEEGDSEPERYLEGEGEEEEDEREAGFLAGGDRARRGGYDQTLETEINYADAKKMQVTRLQLDKWMDDPIFDQILPHCLVRFPDSQREGIKYYAVGEAARIETREPRKEYTMPESKKRTRKYLVVRSGNSEKVLALSMVSNSAFSVQEFDSYLERLEAKGAPVPTQAMRDLVMSNIEKAENFRYSAEDIARMVEEKKRVKRTPVNIAMEKEKLIAQRNYARQQGREEEAQKFQDRIAELEAMQERTRKDSKRDGGLANVNKRNAMTNFMKQLRGVGNSGVAGASATGNTVDLFSRRQTRPRTYGKTGRAGALDPQNQGRDGTQPAPIDALGEPSSTSLMDIRVDLDAIGRFEPEDERQSVVRQLLGQSRRLPTFEATVSIEDYPPGSILKLEEYSRHMNTWGGVRPEVPLAKSRSGD